MKASIRVVGFCGRLGSGKTTAARELCKVGFTRVRFAQPLKDMLAALGCSDAELDGEAKEVPSELLCGSTPRHAMQTLGTEWGRALIGDDLWVSAWRARASSCALVVVDDVRFPNEVAAIHALGGVVVRIERPDAIGQGAVHTSEEQPIEPDYILVNSGSIDEFLIALHRLAQRAGFMSATERLALERVSAKV